MKRILSLIVFLCLLAGAAPVLAEALPAGENGPLAVTGSMELEYATQFSVDYCEGGYALITRRRGGRVMTFFCDKEYEETVLGSGFVCVGNYLCYKVHLD